MTDAPTSTPESGASRPTSTRRRPPPHYAARRMLVTTIALAVLATAGLVGWQLLNGDSGSSNSTAGNWDRIALVDRTTGGITTVDESGQVDARIAGFGRATDVHTYEAQMALIGVDQIAIVDTRDPTGEPTVVPFERGDTVTPVATTGSSYLLVGSPTGGNVLIVSVADGSVLDVFAAADPVRPLIFPETLRWAADGSAFAAADAANFQTILVQPGVATAIFLPDQPVAVGDELVATSETVGLQVDIALVDHERRDQAKVRSEIPAGAVMIDDVLVMVSVDGGIYRIEAGAETAEQLGTIAVPSGDRVSLVRPAFDQQRIVVAGDTFEAVVDLDGSTVFTTSFATTVEVVPSEPAWRCLPVGGGDTFDSLISLESGEQLADLTGLVVTGTSSDGCTVIGERAGLTEVVAGAGSVRLGQLRAATLGPDGRTVVWTTATGTTELVGIDDEFALTEAIDLSDVSPTNLAVAFLTD